MKFALIMLASGFGNRFGSNKLVADFDGKKLYSITLDKLRSLRNREDVGSLVVVTQYEEIVQELKLQSVDYIINDHAIDGISSSLKLGIEKSLEIFGAKNEKPDALMFFVADQPYMELETYKSMMDEYSVCGLNVPYIMTAYDGIRRGNPVIFNGFYIPELMELTGDEGGKQIINEHKEYLKLFKVAESEIMDIDTPEDCDNIKI